MNPLALETVILTALRDAMPGTRIGSAANFVGSLNLSRLLPAVIVVPGETEPLDDGDSGEFNERQHWAVEIAMLCTPDHANFSADFQPAGELMGQVIAALAGLQAGGGYQTLRYAGRGEPAEPETGRVHFPLYFVAEFAANPEAAG